MTTQGPREGRRAGARHAVARRAANTAGVRPRRGRSSPAAAGGARTLIAASAALAAAVVLTVALVKGAARSPSMGLPLSDTAVIREQAVSKHLDPALIAAIIYAETKFEPRTSSAGALGLMQILPETAHFIAHVSGGVRFTTSDLATPSVNIAYGSWYLRYLLEHYGGDEMLAVAAYNAGFANVDQWVARARAQGTRLGPADIPFPETEAYVQRVMWAQSEYRARYRRELGIR
jgi:soluble lytic murein transglycosylase